MTCLIVTWLYVPETSEFVARCGSEPGFSYRSQEYSEQSKRESETRLKSFRSRHTQFEHFAPAAGEWAL